MNKFTVYDVWLYIDNNIKIFVLKMHLIKLFFYNKREREPQYSLSWGIFGLIIFKYLFYIIKNYKE